MNNLFEQFEKDVYEYGKLAFTLYQVSLSNKDKFIDAVDNKDVEFALNSVNYNVRRTESASLPFDLERAKAGDAVEICDIYGNWFLSDSKTFKPGKYPIIKLAYGGSVSEHNLRMKYPPKASHD